MAVGACMPQRRRRALSCFTRTIRTFVLYCQAPLSPPVNEATDVATTPYAELHAHTNFSFLDGASAPDDLVEQAVARGLTALAATDRNGLYGAVRFMGAAEEAGLHGVVGTEIELLARRSPTPIRSSSRHVAGDVVGQTRPGRCRSPSRAGRSGLGRPGRSCPVTAIR